MTVASEPKPFASLSSGLLARKGAARPAMRPQGFGQGGASLEDLGWNDMGFEPPKPTEVARDVAHDAFGDDVVEHPRVAHPTGLTPVQSPVHTQHAEIADRFAVDDEAEEPQESAEVVAFEPAPVVVRAPVVGQAPTPRRAPRERVAPGSKAKAAFTLRLDPPRHLKLRLACAVNGRSAQQLVTDALDQFLQSMPELEAMAEKAKRKG
ncbi:hypothetical protein ACUXST_000540 [Sphingomonas sp. F9_3S_D5_B_2]|jgi:hypothetical protein